jgi:hypothetical protein
MNKNKQQQPEKIFFNREEVTVISMGLGMILEDMNSVNNGKQGLYPWTPEARKDAKDIYAAAKSAANKLEKFAGIKSELPPYVEGDEKDFFTKES